MHALVKMQDDVSCRFAKHPKKIDVVEVMLIKLWVSPDFPEIAAQLLRNTTISTESDIGLRSLMHHCVKVESIKGQTRQQLYFLLTNIVVNGASYTSLWNVSITFLNQLEITAGLWNLSVYKSLWPFSPSQHTYIFTTWLLHSNQPQELAVLVLFLNADLTHGISITRKEVCQHLASACSLRLLG